jgi:type II secretory pathway predicted ATPase ExeA
MYSEFFKLKVNPFGDTPDTRFFFKSDSHVVALDCIMSAIRHGKGFTLVTGEVGTGKTMLSRLLINYLQKRMPTALILNPIVSQLDLLTSIREELKLPAPEKISIKTEYDVLAKFLMETAAEKKCTVLFIDEAQRLSFEAFEAVRLLSNLETDDHKLLQVILVGQPELKKQLDHFNLRQLRQRISIETEIAPLSPAAVEGYIKHRIEVAGGTNFIRFDAEVYPLIAKVTKGIPRLVNSLCENILLVAEKNKIRLVDISIVQDVCPAAKRSKWKSFLPNLGRGAQP